MNLNPLDSPVHCCNGSFVPISW